MNFHHSLPFFVSAILGIVTVLFTIALIKENTVNIKKEDHKFSFDFYNYSSALKLFLAVFFIYLGYGGITPFFVKYCERSLHLSADTASFSLLLLTISGAIFAYPLGVISDKTKRKNVMFGGTLIFAAALFMGVFVKESMGLYATMFICGIGFIGIQVTSYAILAEVVPKDRLGEFMGVFNFFVSFSQFISGNLMGVLLDFIGYKVFFPLSLLWIIIAVLIIGFSKFEKME